MAIFNIENYSGKDLYTDGDVEDLIFGIVKEGLDWKKFAGTGQGYAVMYHLSAGRENILNWYPFEGSASILEVGSGCGAVTGLLCEKAGWVTSVELSKKRAGINHARHANCGNLEILVGNLNEIELGRQYDYVVLTGVFEYAASYGSGPDPYASFLSSLKKHLKRDGKLLLAIENRLGVKYFSGALEDHTDVYYEGIKNYADTKSVRTFSKAELEGLFQRCGIERWKFYYPYPDYKFPTEIFTDGNVNTENYGRVYSNYQNGKVEIFNELEMAMALKREKAMGSFSNSFFVELCIGNAKPSDIAYAKLNHARKKKYQIRTTIKSCPDGSVVEKSALHKEAASHINRIYKNQQKALPAGFRYLQGELGQGAITYPYVKEKNLDSCFLDWMQANEISKIQGHMDRICGSLLKASAPMEDFYSEGFRACFGSGRYEGQLECIKGCNIDLIFDNLFWTGQEYLVIDPEWAFDFWIPVKFILWRMLNEWYFKYAMADSLLPRERLHRAYGITEAMSHAFRRWAIHFASCFVSDAGMEGLAGLAKPVEPVNIDHILKAHIRKDKVESALYVDYGDGFSEKDKLTATFGIKEGKFQVKFSLDCGKKVCGLRWDPVEGRFCRCRIERCSFGGQPVETTPLNADSTDPSVFWNLDPQVAVLVAWNAQGSCGETQMDGGFPHGEGAVGDRHDPCQGLEEGTDGERHGSYQGLGEGVVGNQYGPFRELEIVGEFQYLREGDLEQMICKLGQENQTLQVEKGAVEIKMDALEAEKKELELEKNVLASEKKELESEKNVLASEKKVLASDKEMLCQERDALLERQDLLQRERDGLTDRLQCAQSELFEIRQSRVWKLRCLLRGPFKHGNGTDIFKY